MLAKSTRSEVEECPDAREEAIDSRRRKHLSRGREGGRSTDKERPGKIESKVSRKRIR